MLKNVAGQNITALLLDTNGAAVTTGTTTVYVTGDAGTQTSMGTATHEGNGQWSIDVTQAESNYDDIGFLWTNAGAVSVNQHVFTDQSYDRLGAPAGASVSADIATVDSNVDAVLLDTGTDGVVVATASKTGYRLSAAGVDDVWDEAAADHVAAGSFGARLSVARSATAQGGAASTITLDASASSTDDFYTNNIITIVSGTGSIQGNRITDYNGTTKVATVQDTWATNPDATSVFVIIPEGSIPGASAPTAADNAAAVWDRASNLHTSEGSFGAQLQPSHEGTLQAATATTATLDATGSSSTDDFYLYGFIKIIAGTGAGQPARQITAYNGTSKVATVALAWTTTPDATSQYVLTGDLGIDAATVDSIADGVWDEARADHIAAGSFGEYVLADATRISGSTNAADLLEAATAGTTPLPSNVTEVGGAAQDLPTATNMQVIDDNVDAILVDTGTTLPAQITAILTTTMTEAYAADGAEMTAAQALYAIQQRLLDADVAGTTLTVRQLNGTTAAYTLTLDDGTTPTDVKRTG